MSSVKGMFLWEALAAAAIVSVTALLVCSAVMTVYHGNEDTAEAARENDEDYAAHLERVNTCTITCSPGTTAMP